MDLRTCKLAEYTVGCVTIPSFVSMEFPTTAEGLTVKKVRLSCGVIRFLLPTVLFLLFSGMARSGRPPHISPICMQAMSFLLPSSLSLLPRFLPLSQAGQGFPSLLRIVGTFNYEIWPMSVFMCNSSLGGRRATQPPKRQSKCQKTQQTAELKNYSQFIGVHVLLCT